MKPDPCSQPAPSARRSCRRVAALLLCTGLAACGGDSASDAEPAAPRDYIREWYGDPAASCLPAGCGLTPTAVSCGYRHTCVSMADGTVRCFGDDEDFRLGGASRLQPVPGLTDVVRVRAGGAQTCVVQRGGTAKCFGWMNTEAVVANVSTDPQAVRSIMPRTVAALNNSPVGELGGIGGLACAITATDEASIQCWGEEGTYGLGTVLTTERGVDLRTLNRRFVDVSLSFWNMGLVRLDGSGSLCNANNASTCEILLGNRRDIVHIAPGGLGGAFVLLRDGTVRAAGYPIGVSCSPQDSLPGPDGQCYAGCIAPYEPCHGLKDPSRWYPIGPNPVPGLERVAQIETNQIYGSPQRRVYACARFKDGTVACWGDNSYGQLGIGPPEDKRILSPQSLAAIRDAVQISVGEQHACALTRQHELYCWGANDRGQLGDTRMSGQPPRAPVSFTD